MGQDKTVVTVWKRRFFCMALLWGMVMSNSGCQSQEISVFGVTETSATEAEQQVAECLEQTLTALQTLDMEKFNQYTDNGAENDLGLKEYMIFGGLCKEKPVSEEVLEQDKRFAKAVMADFTWKTQEVTVTGEQAKAKVTIENRDLTDVIGRFTADVLESISSQKGGSPPLDLASYVEEQKGTTFVSECTVTLEQEKNGRWKLLLEDEIVNAIFGNMNTEKYSPEVQEKIDTQEKKLEKDTEDFARDIEQKSEEWTKQLEKELQGMY